LAYKAVNYVKQVQNYLNKTRCQYAIGSVLPGLTEHREIITKSLIGTPGFFVAYAQDRIKYVDATTFFTRTKPVNNLFDDTGSDGFHPGPQQHENYAEQFLKQLNK
jgi:hypothetical protein